MKLFGFGVLESQGLQAEHGSTQHVGRFKKKHQQAEPGSTQQELGMVVWKE